MSRKSSFYTWQRVTIRIWFLRLIIILILIYNSYSLSLLRFHNSELYCLSCKLISGSSLCNYYGHLGVEDRCNGTRIYLEAELRLDSGLSACTWELRTIVGSQFYNPTLVFSLPFHSDRSDCFWKHIPRERLGSKTQPSQPVSRIVTVYDDGPAMYYLV